ncbi:MAG: hypothetical protein ACQCXQ_03425 [Verrucomicrobiales bacterium]|nr:hypothetical protein [Verrucomicrobiota bacterium JB025]
MKINPLRKSLLTLTSLALTGTLQAGITVHGSATGYQSNDKDWQSNVIDDIDFNGLGTDGYIFFGDFDGAGGNETYAGGPGGDITAIDPAHVTDVLPSYITSATMGANVSGKIGSFASYEALDNPLIGDGTDGFCGNIIILQDTAGEALNFTISGLSAGETVRVGVVTVLNDDARARWDIPTIGITDGVNSAYVTDLPNLSSSEDTTGPGWVFFDIDSDGDYTLLLPPDAAGTDPDHTGLGGVTFDSGVPSDPDSDGDGILDWWERAKTGSPGNLTDLNGLASGPGPGAGTGDFDGDGLSDLEEFNLAVTDATYPTLDPTLADTDSDGRNDGDEVNGTTGPPAIPATDPTDPDHDDDGLLDGVESNSGSYVDANDTGTNPTVDDSDEDGLVDGFEVTNHGAGYDPNVDDSATDFDGDASTVANELLVGTNVLLADTDSDGFYDGAETNTGTFVSYNYSTNTGDTGTNPLDDDSDNDDLLDGVETATDIYVSPTDTGTDPTIDDSDEDGLEDGFEVTNHDAGYDPNVDDSATDFDGDASTVANELLVGTNVLLPDTDSDGFYDGAETNTGTFVSYNYSTNTGDTGTNPLNDDSDGDGLLDGVESNSKTYSNPTDTGTDPNGYDSDGDRYSDGVEVANATDPTDKTSFPAFAADYAETGGDWLSMGDNDIDGDGGLGTDGFFFFGDFDGAAENNQDFTHHVASVPSYVSEIAAGADLIAVAAEYDGYGAIDDPILLDGTDGYGGVALGSGAGVAGASYDLLTFTIAGLPEGTTVRVGVLGGVEANSDGRWDPTSITLSDGTTSATVGDHDLNPLPASPGGVNAGWAFFDVITDGVYTVSATQRLSTQGAGIGGLTFDSSTGNDLALAIESSGTDLVFTWESKTGKLYNLLRSTDLSTPPSTWEVWQAGIPADGSGTNVETYARPADPRSFFVLAEMDAPALFEEDFEGDNGGFTTAVTAGTEWAWGAPNSAGFGGSVSAGNGESANCWGTDIGAPGFYVNPTTESCLRSAVIDLTGVAAAELSFAQAIDIHGNDTVTVNIIDDTTDTVIAADIVSISDGNVTSAAWTTVGPVEIPAAALGQAVRIEWCFSGTGGTTEDYLGWYIDDVLVEEP